VIVMDVKPLGNVWLIRRTNASFGEVYDRKTDAVGRARFLVRCQGGGRLRILTRNGVEEECLEAHAG